MNGLIILKFLYKNLIYYNMKIEIFTLIFKRKKSVEDYIKLFVFGFFVAMAFSYIGHLKPLESDE